MDKERLFRAVYDEVFPIVVRIAYRIAGSMEVAEELCHDGFIKYYERIDQFPDRNQAKYWLIRVVKNLALNVAKRKTREQKAYERLLRQPERKNPSGEDQYIKSESFYEVQEALEQLPDNLRLVLILKEYGELDYKEIGSILGISEGNVKVRVFRGREKLAALLSKGGGYVT